MTHCVYYIVAALMKRWQFRNSFNAHEGEIEAVDMAIALATEFMSRIDKEADWSGYTDVFPYDMHERFGSAYCRLFRIPGSDPVFTKQRVRRADFLQGDDFLRMCCELGIPLRPKGVDTLA